MSSHQFLFYCAEAEASSRAVRLSGSEHHHFARVLRGKAGAPVLITNGRGLILECRVVSVDRTFTNAEVLSVVENRTPGPGLVLALAVIRREKFEQAFEQCTELGITACLPFVSGNSHARGFSASYLERLRKVAVSAAKQSFRPFVPDVSEPVGFDEIVREAEKTQRLVVGRQGRAGDTPPVSREAPETNREAAGNTMIVVGPEAGLTDAEHLALEAAGAVYLSISPHRLRSETAAVALVAAVSGGG